MVELFPIYLFNAFLGLVNFENKEDETLFSVKILFHILQWHDFMYTGQTLTYGILRYHVENDSANFL